MRKKSCQKWEEAKDNKLVREIELPKLNQEVESLNLNASSNKEDINKGRNYEGGYYFTMKNDIWNSIIARLGHSWKDSAKIRGYGQMDHGYIANLCNHHLHDYLPPTHKKLDRTGRKKKVKFPLNV
ncbi:hypothetical protein L1987_71520 [Smallanthus sonchifolius]|uniref:Uncharacterized protein n=1 Tax=Smallanthus sonchifolius TaxID=185202 RepID=A0ACB9ATJ3_9ASTR|nr:hypothetical protein L1987_71520 [Smallanthus sonchifolius]